MKKIIVAMVSAIILSCSAMYACNGHCDFDNPKYEEERIIFDMAMELYSNFGEEIEIEECLSMARNMYEMEKAKAELNKKEMGTLKK